MTYEVQVRGRKVLVSVSPAPGGGYEVSLDGGPVRVVSAEAVGAAEWLVSDEQRGRRKVALHLAGDRFTAQVGGAGVSGTVEDPRSRALHAGEGAGAGAIRSPMPGAVSRLLVKVGDAVHQGQVLVVVEAMKMENEFKSPIDGVVTEVGVAAGTTIEAGVLLVTVSAGGAA